MATKKKSAKRVVKVKPIAIPPEAQKELAEAIQAGAVEEIVLKDDPTWWERLQKWFDGD